MPTCGDNDILIRVAACGVNPIDWKIRAGYLSQVLQISYAPDSGSGMCGDSRCRRQGGHSVRCR